MNKYDFSTARGSLTRLAVRALELERQIARAEAQFDETDHLSVEDRLVQDLSHMEYAMTDEIHTIHNFRLALRRQEAIQEQAQLEAALSRSQGRMENLSEEVVRLARERTELERLLTVQKLSGVHLGGKIPTIKVVRERLNVGLKEAKDLVDSWPIFWRETPPRFLTTEEDTARKTIHDFGQADDRFIVCDLPGCGKAFADPIHTAANPFIQQAEEVNPFLRKAIEDAPNA